ncbi:beta-lactamase family protein [Actinoplanes bogorensis]|uniref:Beta-lactamase family protein n=1 Tax=Paractinoplanes bogorensis TaxID=1610840 RepID=A0ABS5Z051_9ACTN|nr:serine hydrolase domain-containing protein [Actinoplanes bogorensis]MBU2669023.1 beta-lactamase family protein [Actinoplanes bogorensis]
MVTPAAVRETLDLVSARGTAAQLCVLRDGQFVVDRSFGAEPRDPFLLLSAGKPFVALLVHQLAERGALGLDDPLARHWPEFGARGKQGITIRHVLQHRSGLPYGRSLAHDALAAPDWDRSVRALAAARPRTPPGAVPAYHVLSYGFLLGELVRRVTGEPVAEVLRRDLLEPLGLRDTSLGGPVRIPLRGSPVRQTFLNRRWFRAAEIPAATVASTARDLARLYQALLDGGQGVLAPATIAEACRPSADGEVDRLLRRTVRWAQGFQLGGSDDGNPSRSLPFGQLSSREAFGHNGSGACLGWADPSRGLVMVYLTNRLQPGMAGAPHLCAVSDALLRGCG